ncbi:phage head closure protein [Sporosarcina saromensis]|uniref:Phage head closure protein n=1 Tax=Sporosarcina saromensis TaxID=359365 RepID=A0ABU4G5J2_9BACL|nr:phage head closure protein [Sporosarcina saromensis]
MVKHDPYNDGFLTYGRDVTQYDGKKTIGKVFESQGTMAFTEMSARDQDYQLVDALGSTLDLKVKTMYPFHMESQLINKLVVHLKGVKYETIKVDRDRNKEQLFWYLQKVGVVSERIG